jgi:hypothetical protein
MDRAPAADVGSGLYCKRGCLGSEWIMTSQELYSECTLLDGGVADALDFRFLRIKA